MSSAAWKVLYRTKAKGKEATERRRITRRLRKYNYRIDRFEIINKAISPFDSYKYKRTNQDSELDRLIREQETDDRTYQIKHDLSYATVGSLGDSVGVVYDEYFAGVT